MVLHYGFLTDYEWLEFISRSSHHKRAKHENPKNNVSKRHAWNLLRPYREPHARARAKRTRNGRRTLPPECTVDRRVSANIYRLKTNDKTKKIKVLSIVGLFLPFDSCSFRRFNERGPRDSTYTPRSDMVNHHYRFGVTSLLNSLTARDAKNIVIIMITAAQTTSVRY